MFILSTLLQNTFLLTWIVARIIYISSYATDCLLHFSQAAKYRTSSSSRCAKETLPQCFWLWLSGITRSRCSCCAEVSRNLPELAEPSVLLIPSETFGTYSQTLMRVAGEYATTKLMLHNGWHTEWHICKACTKHCVGFTQTVHAHASVNEFTVETQNSSYAVTYADTHQNRKKRFQFLSRWRHVSVLLFYRHVNGSAPCWSTWCKVPNAVF